MCGSADGLGHVPCCSMAFPLAAVSGIFKDVSINQGACFKLQGQSLVRTLPCFEKIWASEAAVVSLPVQNALSNHKCLGIVVLHLVSGIPH